LYPYQATRPDELSFPKGVTLNIVEKKSQVPPHTAPLAGCCGTTLVGRADGWTN
jgi:hypothetical protein